MTTNKSLRSSLIALVVLLGTTGPLVAQNTGIRVGAGASFEGFVFDNRKAVGMHGVALATAPFAARYTGPVIVEVAGSYAHGLLVSPTGDLSTVTGLTDTSIMLSVPLANERISLTGTAFLPTGNASQTIQEAAVAGVIAADLLPFRISNWGTGGGFDLSASVAVPVGGFGIGARVGYSAAREFEPLAGPEVFSYQPGNQTYVRVAVDHSIGATSKASLSATMQRFSDDAFDGENLYRSGDRLEVLAALDLGAGNSGNASLYAGVMHRSQSAFLDGSEDFAAQDLIVAGAGLRLPFGNSAFLPSTDLRVFRREDGVGQGYLVGVGASFELGAFIPTIRGRVGNLVVNDQSRSRLYGGEVGLAVRLGR
ncbi:MAG: hypothetical protein ACRENP_16155 [Longimicrobiales bacterium]